MKSSAFDFFTKFTIVFVIALFLDLLFIFSSHYIFRGTVPFMSKSVLLILIIFPITSFILGVISRVITREIWTAPIINMLVFIFISFIWYEVNFMVWTPLFSCL